MSLNVKAVLVNPSKVARQFSRRVSGSPTTKQGLPVRWAIERRADSSWGTVECRRLIKMNLLQGEDRLYEGTIYLRTSAETAGA